jgi:spore coat polysaccharide biosynthesis predicted glycosyltransferase SpsG
MGHFFRACILADMLAQVGRRVKFYINEHAPAINRLRARGAQFEIVPLFDSSFNWESAALERDRISLWIYDRHRTDAQSTARIKARKIPLVTFDDRGPGAADADLHVAALSFDPDEELAGRRVLRGVDYLVLSPDIARYRRLRVGGEKCLVTLGGTDTYGVTPKVVCALARAGRVATVVVGPGFEHGAALAAVTTPDFTIKRDVPSLYEEFAHHDFAVTGGGVTPFEANASGLPCIVVANEQFEVPVGRALAAFGGAVFAGHHSSLNEEVFTRPLPVEAMSKAALDRFTTTGVKRVVEAIQSL